MAAKNSQVTWRAQARRALSYARPYAGTIAVILALTLLGAGLNAIEPLVLKYIFDELSVGGASRTLLTGVVGLVVLGLGRQAATGVSNWLTWRVRLGVQYGLLEATVGRIHSLPLTFHDEESVGGIMTKLDRGINGFVGALTEIAFNVIPTLVYLALSLGFMVRMDWRLSVVVLVFTPLPALIGVWAADEQTERERLLLDRWASIYSRFNEVLAAITTVKSFTMEDEERGRFLRGVDAANGVVIRGVGVDTRVDAAKNVVAMLARVAAVGVGGWLVLQGDITVGTLVAFLGYVSGLFGPVQGLTTIYQTLRKASVSLTTIFSILDAQDHLSDAPDARETRALRGDVVFEGVHFGYRDEEPVLRGIDLHIRAGECVALVGPSGAGKTTLVALVQRLYDPSAGSIRVDGLDLRTLKQRSLRSQIGVVLQETLLFDDTVLNNIAYGRPGASRRKIEQAARAANAHDFIMQLPQGYATPVGERGSRLSAGQRQRIAIARALLKDPPILILDEATSALDAESEALVQEALDRLVRGRTTLIIAHRLSTVVGADRIIVLRYGRVRESGSHEELMETGGYYASLVRRQTDRLLVADAA